MRKIIQKINYLILLMVLGILFQSILFPSRLNADPKEKAKKGVAKVLAYKSGGGIDVGAGIILCPDQPKVFIMTVYHVVMEADSIHIKLNEYPAETFRAKLFEKIDKENDIAVVFIEVSEKLKKVSTLFMGDVQLVKELDKVIALGHPGDFEWQLSSAEIRSTEPSYLKFSGEAVDPGNSGGPLFNEKLQLIGIITQKSPKVGTALKIDNAFEILEAWNIPNDIKLNKDIGWIKKNKKRLLVWGGGAVIAGIATYFIVEEVTRPGNLPEPPVFPKK